MLTGKCTGDKLETSQCQSWCNRNPASCKTALKNYCVGDKLNDSFCQESAREHGGMDTSVYNFCADHAGVAFLYHLTLEIMQLLKRYYKNQNVLSTIVLRD